MVDLLKCCASNSVKILGVLTSSVILPLHKSGSECNPKHYRGMTVLPIVAKIYSKVLPNKLLEWSINNTILIQEQFGFRPNYHTTDAIFILQTLIEI